MNYDEKYEFLTIGDSSVGKTSILAKWDADKFHPNQLATTGLDFVTKEMNIKDKIVRVRIWDTAGQERYRSQTMNMFKRVEGIILVFDLSNEESFLNLKYWISVINEKVGELKIHQVILGNKCDLTKEVTIDEAEKLAKNNGMKFFETSAKTGTGIKEGITDIVMRVFNDRNLDKRESRISDLKANRQSSGVNDVSSCKC